MTAMSVICWVDPHNPVLEPTLEAYARQRAVADFEVVVVSWEHSAVDQSEPTRRVAAAYPEMAPRLRYVRSPVESRARSHNLAVEQTDSPLLLFASADFVPEPGHIEAHLSFHREHPEDECIGIGAGRSPAVQRAGNDFLVWAEDNGMIFGVDMTPHVPAIPADYFYCGNASIKTSFFKRVGCFDGDFPYEAMDDYEFGLRAVKHGMRSYFVTGAVAVHNHPLTFDERKRQMTRAGRSAALLWSKYPDKTQILTPLWRQRCDMYQAAVKYAITRSKADRINYWELSLHEAFSRAYFAHVRSHAPVS